MRIKSDQGARDRGYGYIPGGDDPRIRLPRIESLHARAIYTALYDTLRYELARSARTEGPRPVNVTRRSYVEYFTVYAYAHARGKVGGGPEERPSPRPLSHPALARETGWLARLLSTGTI